MQGLKGRSYGRKQVTWDKIDESVINDLNVINTDGGDIVLLTSTIISPQQLNL